MVMVTMLMTMMMLLLMTMMMLILSICDIDNKRWYIYYDAVFVCVSVTKNPHFPLPASCDNDDGNNVDDDDDDGNNVDDVEPEHPSQRKAISPPSIESQIIRGR